MNYHEFDTKPQKSKSWKLVFKTYEKLCPSQADAFVPRIGSPYLWGIPTLYKTRLFHRGATFAMVWKNSTKILVIL